MANPASTWFRWQTWLLSTFWELATYHLLWSSPKGDVCACFFFCGGETFLGYPQICQLTSTNSDGAWWDITWMSTLSGYKFVLARDTPVINHWSLTKPNSWIWRNKNNATSTFGGICLLQEVFVVGWFWLFYGLRYASNIHPHPNKNKTNHLPSVRLTMELTIAILIGWHQRWAVPSCSAVFSIFLKVAPEAKLVRKNTPPGRRFLFNRFYSHGFVDVRNGRKIFPVSSLVRTEWRQPGRSKSI